MLSQPVIANSPVVALNIGVLLRLPGWIYASLIPRRSAQDRSTWLMYSGPSSQRNACGFPRQSMIWYSVRITLAVGSEKSTSIPSPSQLKSSITLNNRMPRPFSRLSCIKSINQVSLAAVGTDRASSFSRIIRFFGLMRRFNSNSR